jgi:hypothetical protein
LAEKLVKLGHLDAGTVRAPLGCFENALEAYAKELGIDVE